MLISIVIIVRNEENRIRQNLESLINQWHMQDNEIIIVDGFSQDKTREIVEEYTSKYCFVKLVGCDTYGYSYQRNVGASKASGEYVLYISGDTYASSNLLEKYLKAIDKGYDVVQGSIININGIGIFGKYMEILHPLVYSKSMNGNLELFSTVNVLIKRDLLLTHPFNEKIKSLEDKEWFLRLSPTVRFHYLKSAAIYHHIHETFVKYLKKISLEAEVIGKILNNSIYSFKIVDSNIFNWPRFTFLLIIIELISIFFFLVSIIIRLDVCIAVIPSLIIGLWLFYPLIYVANLIKHRIHKNSNLFLATLFLYSFFLVISVGITKGYVLRLFSRRNINTLAVNKDNKIQ